MAEESGGVFDAALVDGILPLAAGLPERLHRGIDVADIGCGSGHAVNVMAQAFPASRFTGFDFSDRGARHRPGGGGALGLDNATSSPLTWQSWTWSRRSTRSRCSTRSTTRSIPPRVLANIHRALRPGGVLLMVDIKASSNLEDNVEHSLGVTVLHDLDDALHDRVAIGGRRRGWAPCGVDSWQPVMLAEAGFGAVTVLDVEDDPFNSYYIAAK